MIDLIDQGAEFSADRVYRYRLWRRWGHGPMLMVIGLNPSTADETVNDPTVRRCVQFAKDWGYAGLRMLNLFAYRATDPHELYQLFHWTDPVGLLNDLAILDTAQETIVEGGAVLAAWGNHGGYKDRGSVVYAMLHHWRVSVACLGLTKFREPRHPLYLAKSTQPMRFLGDGGRLVTEPRIRGVAL